MITKSEKRIVALMLAMLMGLFSVVASGTVVYAEETDQNIVCEVVEAGKQYTTTVNDTEKTIKYQFVPEKTGIYKFYSSGDEDTSGYLYDEEGNLLNSQSDGGSGLNFSMDLQLEAGMTYYLGVGYFLENQEGSIQWQIDIKDEKISSQKETEVMEEQSKTEAVESYDVLPEERTVVDRNVKENYQYTVLADGTVEINGYTGTESVLSLPETIDGRIVSSIGENAFRGNEILAEVTIPKSVTTLQYQSFASCKNLTNVTMESGSKLQTIEGASFFECEKLEGFVCPDGVTSIGNNTFWDCKALKEVVFNKKLITIGRAAFAGAGLEKADLPDSLTELGDTAFSGCLKLKEVHISTGIKEIKKWTFNSCESLEEIKIPDNIVSIGENAFLDSGLKKIDIPDSVESIGKEAFSRSRNLQEVIIGNGLSYVAQDAFSWCDLKNIKIGNKVKTIADYSFVGNCNLKNVTVPKNVTEIEYAVFDKCTSLETIELPADLGKIGGEAFRGTVWYENQKDGVVYAAKALYKYKGQMPENTEIEVKAGTKGISSFAFQHCTNLKNIIIPDSLTTIGDYAFYDCTEMNEITIPDTVTEIGKMSLGYVDGKDDSSATEIIDERYQIANSVKKNPEFKIHGESGTVAERYADENGFTFIKNKHTIIFKDGDQVIDTQIVASGDDAVLPNITKEGYILAGWSGNYTNVKADGEVTAIWRAKTGWEIEDNNWYYYEDGKKQTDRWIETNGKTYYVNKEGVMAKDTWIGNRYVDKNGVWQTNYEPEHWVSSNGRWWYRYIDGTYPSNCWKFIDNCWYYFDRNGYRVTDWQVIGGAWYYFDTDGAMTIGWYKVGNIYYYFDDNGIMKTGWILSDGQWYYLDGSGAMQVSWKVIGSCWYYFDKDGTMVTDWQEIGGTKYYFSGSGAMETGWILSDGQWYYLNGSGAMQINWQAIGGNWYYFDKDGTMVTDWQEIGDTKYYFDAGGAMRTGWLVSDGSWYYLNGSGAMITNCWISGTYYMKADGRMAVSEWVDNDRYYVDSNGAWVPNQTRQ